MTRDGGAAGVLLLSTLAPIALLGVVLVLVIAQLAVARTAAQAAADAAALAAAPLTFHPYDGVGDPEGAAASAARDNGATLTRCECRTDRTWAPRVAIVGVEAPVRLVGVLAVTVTAEAAAEFRPVDLLR